jgi:hypothetical protein
MLTLGTVLCAGLGFGAAAGCSGDRAGSTGMDAAPGLAVGGAGGTSEAGQDGGRAAGAGGGAAGAAGAAGAGGGAAGASGAVDSGSAVDTAHAGGPADGSSSSADGPPPGGDAASSPPDAAPRCVPESFTLAVVPPGGGSACSFAFSRPYTPGQINLVLSPGWGTVCHAGSSQGCGRGASADGWWVNGNEILLCDATCARFYRQTQAGRLTVQTGCPTQACTH